MTERRIDGVLRGCVELKAADDIGAGGMTTTNMDASEATAELSVRRGDLRLQLGVALSKAFRDNVVDKTVAIRGRVGGTQGRS